MSTGPTAFMDSVSDGSIRNMHIGILLEVLCRTLAVLLFLIAQRSRCHSCYILVVKIAAKSDSLKNLKLTIYYIVTAFCMFISIKVIKDYSLVMQETSIVLKSDNKYLTC